MPEGNRCRVARYRRHTPFLARVFVTKRRSDDVAGADVAALVAADGG
jgi:hypothetical protein